MAAHVNALSGAGVNGIDMDPTLLPDDVLRDIPTRRLNWLFRRYHTPPILRIYTKQKRRRLKCRVYSRNYRARNRQQAQGLRLQAIRQRLAAMRHHFNNNGGQLNNNRGQLNNNSVQLDNNRGQLDNNRSREQPQSNRTGFFGWLRFF